MRKALTVLGELKSVLNGLKKDDDGAALIEYTVLLGILLVAVIAIIIAVGIWVSGQWPALSTSL